MSTVYTPDWESIDSRPVPAWFADAKFGIFIHWGLYSVPAFSRKDWFAEWYQPQIQEQQKEEILAFHNRVYGKNFRYADFVPQFRTELFDAAQWIKLFERAGAKYMNITSKHHDGFCLFPSKYAWNWNSVDCTPHRDLCGELRDACEGSAVRFGVYHSIYEWYHPLYLENPERFALEHLHPMMKDLIERYQPHTLFTDGEWDHPAETWHSQEFLQWLYNDSSVRDFIVPNDRWGTGTRKALHGGNATTEYGSLELHTADFDFPKPFEECRGIGGSFGFNRAEEAEDYLTGVQLIRLLVDLAARGGNLLLNIGPAADGTIPALMQDRLLEIGRWLAVNGEAIYGTRKGVQSAQEGVRYTRKGAATYVFLEHFPFGAVVLEDQPYDPARTATLLGWKGEGNPVTTVNADGKTALRFSGFPPEALESKCYYCVRLG
ncbi:MAG: alpha-L-fucosidase [Oscillospiraceae bacterium]|jgi:alpha-L-fucosidase|nr:alpha-L-fucosidase [Oscillospiraceae bacterium]